MAPYPQLKSLVFLISFVACLAILAEPPVKAWEQRDEVSFLRGPYNIEFRD